jgi:hypothetical protein
VNSTGVYFAKQIIDFMESLNALATSLPTANLANAEKDLLNTFKGMPRAPTNLFRAREGTNPALDGSL